MIWHKLILEIITNIFRLMIKFFTSLLCGKIKDLYLNCIFYYYRHILSEANYFTCSKAFHDWQNILRSHFSYASFVIIESKEDQDSKLVSLQVPFAFLASFLSSFQICSSIVRLKTLVLLYVCYMDAFELATCFMWTQKLLWFLMTISKVI